MSDLAKQTYNEIVLKYGDSKLLPFRVYLEKPTLLNLLGNVTYLDALDLACGNGFYTRILKHQGSVQTFGVDISDEMINVARTIEFEELQGISYMVKDVSKLKKIGSFDVVIAAYLLNYAQNEAQLKAFCKTIYQNLKPGARFVGVNDNVHQNPETYDLTKKYGFVKSLSDDRKEGSPIHYTFFKNGKKDFSFNNYYLNPETYERVFKDTGFKSFNWHPLKVNKEGIDKFKEGYWDDFLTAAPLIGMVAEK